MMCELFKNEFKSSEGGVKVHEVNRLEKVPKVCTYANDINFISSHFFGTFRLLWTEPALSSRRRRQLGMSARPRGAQFRGLLSKDFVVWISEHNCLVVKVQIKFVSHVGCHHFLNTSSVGVDGSNDFDIGGLVKRRSAHVNFNLSVIGSFDEKLFSRLWR
jgi:hypothetical protein